ncbi:MAG: DUF2269 family protein [Rhizobiaceae bacterium]|nr:DUF2269 family protein [Rhizobiaceae bacterium]
MDYYTLVKFIHIVAAMIWLGGGFTLMLLSLQAERSADPEAVVRSLRSVTHLGNQLFVPTALITLISGLVMAWFWVGFRDLWIIIALAGFAGTFLMGAAVLKPAADRMIADVARDGVTPAILQDGRRLLRFGRFDYALMLVVVADMVFKPAYGDVAVPLAMGIFLAASAAFFLLPRREIRAAAA